MFRLFIALSSALIFSSSLCAQNLSCIDHQCMAVIDAGSTGSRVHMYAYDEDESQSPIHITEIWSKKVSPGFASIDPSTESINSYIETLLTGAPEQHMPVYFYATAGMRLVSVSKQKKYYENLTAWFTQQPNWDLKEAKTISGSEEGLYDWLSINYQLGTFDSSDSQSVGVMDIGGASVQIAFPIQDKGINSKSITDLDLYGKHYRLFVHSFLGLGQNEMSHQFLNSSACFPNGYFLPDGQLGLGNANHCEEEVASLVNNVHNVKKLIQPILAKNNVDTWYALGGLSNLASHPLFNFDNNQLTNQKLLQQGDNRVCNQMWDVLNKAFPNDNFLYQYCLFPSYYYALMVDGYGLLPEKVVNFVHADKNMDWAAGVVVYHPAVH